MRDLIETRALCPVAGANAEAGNYAKTAYKEPISPELLRKTPVAAKNYFSKDIPDMSSKIFFSARFFSSRPSDRPLYDENA